MPVADTRCRRILFRILVRYMFVSACVRALSGGVCLPRAQATSGAL